MAAPNWDAIAERLFQDTRRAIAAFAVMHPAQACCRVEFFCDPGNGDLSLGFDTPQESVRAAREHHDWVLSHVAKSFEANPRAAHSILKGWSLMPWNLGAGEMAHPGAVRWEFPEWYDFAVSDECPAERPGDDDYLASAVTLCLWRVVERLIAEDAFAELPMANPCVVSYCNHDDDEVVIMRVLQWPVV